MSEPAFLSIDQVGHASRAFVSGARGRLLSRGEREIRARRPDPTRAKYNATELWSSIVSAVAAALETRGCDEEHLALFGLPKDLLPPVVQNTWG